MFQALLAVSPMQLLGVHVYLLELDKAPSNPGVLGAFLDEHEKKGAASLRSPDRRRRFMVGRAALRCILSTHGGGSVPESHWRFAFSEHGKPYVCSSQDSRSGQTSHPFFNLSYATGLVAIAMADTVEVGIDIEIGQAFPRDQIPWHLFAEREQGLLRATAPEDFWSAFMRLWTLKEAIAKRTGQGFATEFNEIDTTVLPVIDGLDRIPADPQAEPALCHLSLTLPKGAVHLSVSTAPVV